MSGNPSWRTPAGREKFAFDYLRHTLKLPAAAAAALVGNMAVESRYGGVDFLPGRWEEGKPPSTHTVTTGDAGFGIAQWTFPARKEALRDFAGQKHWGNFAMELAFVASELTHPDRGKGPLVHPETLERLRKREIGIREATAIVMAVYEQPATYREVPKHFASVNQLLREFGKKSPTGPNRGDPSGYNVRLDVVRKLTTKYGKTPTTGTFHFSMPW